MAKRRVSKAATPRGNNVAKPRARKAIPRNPELEASLVAQPDDPAVREVLADWLLSIGDPLGEVLALDNAGRTRAATRLITNRSQGIGGFNRTVLVWRGAFVDTVRIPDTMSSRAVAMLAKIFDRPSSLLVRKASLGFAPTHAVIELISERARTLRHLFCWFGGGIGDLAVATLERLDLFVRLKTPIDVGSLAPLLAAERVPALRWIEVYDKPVSVELLAALLDSKLLRQLEWLGLVQSSVDGAGAKFLLQHAGKLAHLRGLSIDTTDVTAQPEVAAAFATQIEAWQAMKATAQD